MFAKSWPNRPTRNASWAPSSASSGLDGPREALTSADPGNDQSGTMALVKTVHTLPMKIE